MPKMTDYARAGFNRRRRPWDRAETPEWWDLVVWAGLVAIIVMILLGVAFGRDSSSGEPAAEAPAYPVQTINPYRPSVRPSASSSGDASAPAAGSTPGASSTPSAAPSTAPSDDFATTVATQFPVTGGGTAVVPAGARNVALAAARARATGDWAGIPFVGTARPPAARRTPLGSVGEVTVADPSVLGNSQYVFSAMITPGGPARSSVARIAVERVPSGYAVRVI